MADFDNTNSGILTKNDKGNNPKRPDYRGSLNVDGVDYWLSGWIKKGERGKLAGQTFLSLKVEAKEQSGQGKGAGKPAEPPKPATPAVGEDDDVPF